MTRSESSVTSFEAWRSSFSPLERFPRSFLNRGAREVAPCLLGCRLVSTVGGVRTDGVIVETEAYVGPGDPASHAAERIGRTDRNASMFGPAGRAYVYFIYGMHWCLNVVTAGPGEPEAVLIRALDPREGVDAMARRRGRDRALCSGPARLCQALGVTGDLDGHDLGEPPLRLEPGWRVPEEAVGRSGRIGVAAAEEWPLRFFVRGHPEVSRKPRD